MFIEAFHTIFKSYQLWDVFVCVIYLHQFQIPFNYCILTPNLNSHCDVQVDVPIKYLNFFLEDDDELEHIKKVISRLSNNLHGVIPVFLYL